MMMYRHHARLPSSKEVQARLSSSSDGGRLTHYDRLYDYDYDYDAVDVSAAHESGSASTAESGRNLTRGRRYVMT